MPQVEYTDSSNNKHTLDLTDIKEEDLDKFYADYIEKYYHIAINLINDLELEENKKNVFKEYCSSLIHRVS